MESLKIEAQAGDDTAGVFACSDQIYEDPIILQHKKSVTLQAS